MSPTYLQLVRAPNPGPMTLDGTNTWLVGEPTSGPVVVVDPGPLIVAHLDAVVAAAPGGISAVLLTHRHLDHAESAAELARRAGCGVRAADPTLGVGPDGLDDGDRVEVAGATLTAVATPGHTSDSVSLLVAGNDGVVRLLVRGHGAGPGDDGDHPSGRRPGRLPRLVGPAARAWSPNAGYPRSCRGTAPWSPTPPAG